MRLKITHETHYTYTEPPASVIELLRLTPRNSATQSVREWGLEVSNESIMRRFNDAFGNINHTFSAAGPLDELVVRAVGTVETEPSNGVVSGTPEPLPVAVYLRETDLTGPTAALAAIGADAFAACDGTTLDHLHKLMDAVHGAMTQKPGFAPVALPADATLKAGEGVCHDLTHVFLAAARAHRIPARYISGYCAVDGASRDPQATHSWAEAHVEGLGWVGFDPSSNRSPGENYVRLAVGLDSLSAAPVRGAIYGGAGETLTVRVRVERATAPGALSGSAAQSQSQG